MHRMHPAHYYLFDFSDNTEIEKRQDEKNCLKKNKVTCLCKKYYKGKDETWNEQNENKPTEHPRRQGPQLSEKLTDPICTKKKVSTQSPLPSMDQTIAEKDIFQCRESVCFPSTGIEMKYNDTEETDVNENIVKLKKNHTDDAQCLPSGEDMEYQRVSISDTTKMYFLSSDAPRATSSPFLADEFTSKPPRVPPPSLESAINDKCTMDTTYGEFR